MENLNQEREQSFGWHTVKQLYSGSANLTLLIPSARPPRTCKHTHYRILTKPHALLLNGPYKSTFCLGLLFGGITKTKLTVKKTKAA